MKSKVILPTLGLALAMSLSASAAGTNLFLLTVNVPAIGNLWLAGMPDGTIAGKTNDVAPDHVPLVIKNIPADAVCTFSVTGAVSFAPMISLNGPEGNETVTPPDGGSKSGVVSRKPGPENGIADITAPIGSLIGVFLDEAMPTADAPPPLNFRERSDRDFMVLSPELRQPFFIGDGRTAAGDVQKFVAPLGATRLFLGIMDAYGWSDNRGSFTVSVTVTTP